MAHAVDPDAPTLADAFPAGDGPGTRFAPGAVVGGRYRVTRVLGQGGMGTVHEAEDLELRTRVALKTLRPGLARQPEAVERIRSETLLARRVSHPNVCRVFDLGRHGDAVFITMELLEGETLAQRIARSGPLSPGEALLLAEQVAAGLAASHEAGVVHADFKPGNVVLCEPGGTGRPRAVVTDFGVARAAEAPGESTGGTVVGTPEYMAPEQVTGGTVGPAADVYAFGLVLHEALTGRLAFGGTSPLAAATSRLEQPPSRPSDHVPGLDPAWDRVVLRCLERDPARRFASPLEAIRELHAGPPTGPASGRRALAVALGLLAAVVVGSVIWPRRPPAEAPTRPAPRIRTSVAVVGFRGLSPRAEAAWLSTALVEMLTTELAAGEALRLVPAETVARIRAETPGDDLGAPVLTRLRRQTGAGYAVSGTYALLPGPSGASVRLDLKLQETGTGETRAAVVETGTEAELFALVARAGSRLRAALHVGPPAPEVGRSARAGLPGDPEAARLYATGLERLRLFDAQGARAHLEKAVAAEPGRALVHVALSRAWESLGYDGRAEDEARLALDLSRELTREARLLIEAHHHEVRHEWEQAARLYADLISLFPDDLEHGLALARAQTRQRPERALATVARLRQLPEPLRSDPRLDLAEAVALGNAGRHREEREAARRAAEAAAAQGATAIVARARQTEGWALYNLEEGAAAVEALAEARTLHAAGGDRVTAAWVANLETYVRVREGTLPAGEALRAYRASLATFRATGDRRGVGVALNYLAEAHLDAGRLGDARRAFEESLAVRREVRDVRGEAVVLRNLAALARREGHLGDARRLGEASLAADRLVDDVGAAAETLTELGTLAAELGDLPQARARLQEARAVRAGLGNRAQEAAVRAALALVDLDEGRAAEAERAARQAVADGAGAGAETSARLRLALAAALLELGRAREAREAVEPSLAAGSPLDRELLARLLLSAARAEVLLGNPGEARRLLERSGTEARALGSVPLALEVDLERGRAQVADPVTATRGREVLRALARRAETLGFASVARRAAAAATPEGTRP